MTTSAVRIEVLAEALAHATAIQTLSSAGPVRVLATALRELLENASIATANVPTVPVSAPRLEVAEGAPGDRSRPVATADRPEETAPPSEHPEAVRSRRRRTKRQQECSPTPPPVDNRQLDLFAGRDRSRPVASSSSDLKDHRDQKKQTVTVATGDPLDDELWAIARDVIAKRGVALEPEELWKAFVAYHADHRTRFRDEGEKRWRWRRWVTNEKPPRASQEAQDARSDAPPPPESKTRPLARSRPARAPAPRPSSGPLDPELAGLLAAGATYARAPPDPKSASA